MTNQQLTARTQASTNDIKKVKSRIERHLEETTKSPVLTHLKLPKQRQGERSSSKTPRQQAGCNQRQKERTQIWLCHTWTAKHPKGRLTLETMSCQLLRNLRLPVQIPSVSKLAMTTTHLADRNHILTGQHQAERSCEEPARSPGGQSLRQKQQRRFGKCQDMT